MEDSKFFKLLWRFNGFVIAIAGLLTICVLIFGAYNIYHDMNRRAGHNIAAIDDQVHSADSLQLGSFSDLNNNQTVMIPLQSDNDSSRSYYSKSSDSVRNYLFVDTLKSQQFWLFDHNNYLIHHTSKLNQKGCNSDDPAIAIMYQVIKDDTNKDSQLSEADSITIALSKPTGREYIELLQDIDFIIDHSVVNEHDLFVIYEKEKVTYSAWLNLESLTLISNNQVQHPGNPPEGK